MPPDPMLTRIYGRIEEMFTTPVEALAFAAALRIGGLVNALDGEFTLTPHEREALEGLVARNPSFTPRLVDFLAQALEAGGGVQIVSMNSYTSGSYSDEPRLTSVVEIRAKVDEGVIAYRFPISPPPAPSAE